MGVRLLRFIMWGIVIVIALLIIQAMNSTTLSWSTKTQHELRAMAQATLIENTVNSFRDEKGHNPFPEFLEDDIAENIDKVVFTVAFSNAYAIILYPDSIERLLSTSDRDAVYGRMLDPWANPYHVKVSNTNASVVIVGGKVIHRSVAVWSNGENRKNEWGKGDDVCSWKK